MTFICLHYLKFYNENPIEDVQMPEWLKETVLHICDTILNHLETICKEVRSNIYRSNIKYLYLFKNITPFSGRTLYTH